jgi:hypothetical protein
MQLGSQWIVEFGMRDMQAREQRWREKARQEEEASPLAAAPSYGQRCLSGVGHLLLVAGAWLNWQAGEVYRADRGSEPLRDRRVDQRTPSWT